MTTPDIADPFRNDERNGKLLPFKKTGPTLIDFARVADADVHMLLIIGTRCSHLISGIAATRAPGEVIAPHPNVAGLDWAIAHIKYDFDLQRVIELDDLTLTSAYAVIAGRIDRINCVLRDGTAINLPLRSRSMFDRITARFKSEP